MTLVAFGVSPAAFGAPVTAAQLYKQTYIGIKQNKNPVEVLKGLMTAVKENNMDVKEVLQAAVEKGWMSQQQMNVVLDVAAKNAYLANDKEMVNKISTGKMSAADMKTLTEALQGQVTGAAYYCDRYGCYRGPGLLYPLLIVLLLFVIFTPVVVVVH
jgi:uncharacterized protein (UPF0264 family)